MELAAVQTHEMTTPKETDIKFTINRFFQDLHQLFSETPSLQGPLNKIREKVHSLTMTSYIQFFISQANPLRGPVLHQTAATFIYGITWFASAPLSVLGRGIASMYQLTILGQCSDSGKLENRMGKFSLGSMAGYIVSLIISAILYFVEGSGKSDDVGEQIDLYFSFTYLYFLTVTLLLFCIKDWEFDSQFKIEELIKAMDRLPHLKDDPGFSIKDSKGDPVLLPIYTFEKNEAGENTGKRYFSVDEIVKFLQSERNRSSIELYLDQEYLDEVLTIFENPPQTRGGYFLVSSVQV